MTTKLVQKHLFKGTQEFEIVKDSVNVRINKPFKETEKFTVELSVLNPEPVFKESYLEFHSRIKCGALISLYLNKPNAEEFNTFVNILKQKAVEEYNAFAGIRPNPQRTALTENVHDEPPEFDDSEQRPIKNMAKKINLANIDETIQMLETHLDPESVQPLTSALNALKAEPQNETHLNQVVEAFNQLGPLQGAILTYAPYMSALMSDDPFGDD